MIARIAFHLFLLAPSMVWAQDVPVRSGEHADFSRLVLEFDRQVSWSFGRVDGGYELRVDASEILFDISRVFAMIPKTRIAALEDRGGGRLFIASTCECYGDAFDLRFSEVVVDIKDGAARQAAGRFNQVLPAIPGEDGPSNSATTVSLPAVANPEILGASVIQRLRTPREARAGLPIIFGVGSGVSEPAAPAQMTPPNPAAKPVADSRHDETATIDVAEGNGADPDRVSETEQALLKQVGRAAAQGLLDADLDATEAVIDAALAPLPSPDLEPFPVDLPPRTGDQPPDPTDHMQIQTVIDRDLGTGSSEEGPTTQNGLACLPSEHFELENWGVPPSEGADLSLHRVVMLGEFDQASPDHVLGLVRNYIYLTFGAEAAAAARRYEADLNRPDLLIMMAEVMDYGESSLSAAISDQMACAGPVALWATLAQPSLSPSAEIDLAAVIKTFSDLPVHLRRHLGPTLSQKFLESGDVSTANALRDAVARIPGSHGDGFELLEARLDQSKGDDTRAEHRLDGIVKGDGPVAPEALLELIGSRVDAGLPVDERLRELVTSMAYEQRGSDMGAILLETAIRTQAQSARFEEASILLEEADRTYGGSGGRTLALREAFLVELVGQGNDVEFLMRTVPELQDVSLMSPVLRQVVAGRFLGLGFTEFARASLSAPGHVPEVEDRLLFARAALIEGKPEVAMGYLAGLDGVSALRLQAQAQSALADFRGAARSWAQAEDEPARWDAAWLAGDWAQLEQAGETPYQEVARLMVMERPDGFDTDEEGAVSENAMHRSQRALMNSQQARGAVTTLLQKMSSP